MLLSATVATLLMFGSFAIGAPQAPHAPCAATRTEAEAIAAEAHFQKHQVQPGDDSALLAPAIPVYFNVIAANTTIKGGWLTNAQIASQMAVLNKDFANTSLRWNLVKITRVINKDWFLNVLDKTVQETAMKKKYRQGAAGTLNVYTLGLFNKPTLLGFSTFPEDYKSNPKDDGVIIKYTTLPGVVAKSKHNGGRTLTHEVGHWAGLYHTFQGGCTGNGDFVADTPAEATSTFGCPVKQNTCKSPGLDPVHNYMDYTDDDCKTGFTPGQGVRMRGRLRTYRGIKGL